MSKGEGGATSQRRRRSSGSSSSSKSKLWRDPRIDRVVWWAMLGLALAYVGLGMRDSFRSNRDFGMLSIGTPRADVRYTMGAPERAGSSLETIVPSQSADRAMALANWGYDLSSGGRYHVGFGGSSGDIVSQLICEDDKMSPISCPSKLGLPLGVFEDEIWYRLGPPVAQVYAGDVKRLIYPELGTTFYLKRFTLYKVELNERRNESQGILRAIRYLLP